MLADSDLNFHKKLMRFEYPRLYFHDSKFSREIHENTVPQKFQTIRYVRIDIHLIQLYDI